MAFSDAQAFTPSGVNSSTLVTFASVANNDTIVINGTTLTAKTSPAAATEFAVGASDYEAIANFVALVRSPGAGLTASFVVSDPSAKTCVLTFTKAGQGLAIITGGAHITIAQSPVGSSGTDAMALRTAVKGLVVWDSGSIAAGAVIDSPLLDITGVNTLYIVANNGSAATRNLTLDAFLDDGTTSIDAGLVIRTVASGPVVERGTIGKYATAVGTPALQFNYPIALPSKVKLHLVAGGAGAGRVTIFGR
jgi:hypothetical protein